MLHMSLGVAYREPVVHTHDQLNMIGPERAYTRTSMNLPVPVNMFLPPVAQPFPHLQHLPTGIASKRKKMLNKFFSDLSESNVDLAKVNSLRKDSWIDASCCCRYWDSEGHSWYAWQQLGLWPSSETPTLQQAPAELPQHGCLTAQPAKPGGVTFIAEHKT